MAGLQLSDEAIQRALSAERGQVPLDPEGACAHAILIQQGFTTPAIEAFRILEDAYRSIVRDQPLDDRWKEGVRTTLAWIDERSEDDEVARERARWSAGKKLGYRTMLEEASRTVVTCRHCHRTIELQGGIWVDPEAGYDMDGDGIWRETCDSHDTFVADHEPL